MGVRFRDTFCCKMWLILVLFGFVCASSLATSIHIPSTSDHHGKHSSHHDNSSSHDNKTHGNKSHHQHFGIHVASLRYEYVEQPLIIAVFLLTAGIFKLGFHHANFLSSAVPESCMLIILGIVVGAIMSTAVGENYPGLTSTLFFLYLLPPIILESAYSLHDRAFFENVGTVLIFAVIGTILNCFLIGPTLYGIKEMGAMGEIDLSFIQCLVFSAVIVAVDPVAVLAIFQEIGVNNVLYFLVFGESLLNDAVTVVLYNMMIEFNKMPGVPVEQIFLGIVSFFVVSLGGLTVGVLFGILTAIITKFTEHVRVVEPLTVFVLAYISYLIAELFHFSGIISIIGCGLTQAQYAFHNISAKSRTTITYFSKMQSATSDCIIFMFLGIALFKSDMFRIESWHAGFIMWTLFLCLFYRFIVVFSLTYVMNKFNRLRKIDAEEQFIMAYGGLRGAVAFSLVDLLNENPDDVIDEKHRLPKHIFLSTTLSVIFFTVFVQGISIKPLTKLLRVKLQDEKVLSITEEINTHVTDHVMAGIEELLGEHGQHYFREKFEFYNKRYITKWLQRDPMSVDEQIMSMFEEISLQQHFENLAGSKMIQDKYGSTEALITSVIPEEEEDEDEASGSEMGSQELVLPSITVPSVNFVTQDLHDQELDYIRANHDAKRRMTVGNIRRKSVFPGFGKRRDSKEAVENPTAKDIRKLMIPTRRELQHKKLDKNLRDESQADLLKYLQEKQFRTRRMSRAVLRRESSLQSPKSSNLSLNSPQQQRRQSLDASAAVTNYRRRLSLAVPEKPVHHHRGRITSDVTDLHRHKGHGDRIGDASQSPDRPPRRKKPSFKKGLSLGCEPISEEQELSPLIKNKSSPTSPPSPTKPSFEIIHENEELDPGINTSFDSNDSGKSGKKPRPLLKKSRTTDHERVQRSHTDPSSDAKHHIFTPERSHQSAKRRPLMKSESVKSDESVDVSVDEGKEHTKSVPAKLSKVSDSEETTSPQKDDSHSNEKDEIL